MRNTPRKRNSSTALTNLLEDPRIRRREHEGHTWYGAADIIVVLSGSVASGMVLSGSVPQLQWEQMKAREPRLSQLVSRLEFPGDGGELLEMLPMEGVLRVAQSLSSPEAEKIKSWLAAAGTQQVQEQQDPELAWVRLQKLYDHQGYSHRWVQKRLRGMAARQELTREWARRGAADSEEYRQLTNAMIETAFGMDVNGYRRFKQLNQPSENLRDHMTDLELTLTTLGETTAVALHRAHNSEGFEQLQADVKDAGEITRLTREQIERRGGQAVMSPRMGAAA